MITAVLAGWLFLFPGGYPTACTIFVLTDAHRTLFFGNEDYTNPNTRLWFVPAGDGYYGCVYAGFDDGVGQAGMNTQGLAFDWWAGGTTSYKPDPALPRAIGSSSERMLETCATVEEAIAFYRTHADPGFANADIFIADRSGASVVIGARDGWLFFDRLSHSRAIGFGTPVFERLHRRGVPVALGNGTDILRQCVQGGRGGTQYSYTFDLRTGAIGLYRFAERRQGVNLDLSTELAKGAHYYDIPGLAEQVADAPRPLLLNMRRMCLYRFTALDDQATRVTERVRQLLADAAKGRMQAVHYADSLWSEWAPIQQDIKAELVALGRIRSATLIDRLDVGGDRTAFSYIMVCDNARLLMRFVFDRNLRVHGVKSLRGEAL